MNHVILYVTINFVTYTGHTMKSCGQNVGENYGLATWIAWGRKPNRWAFNINHTARQSLILFRLIYSFN